MITFNEIKKSEEIKTYIRKADESLTALGYTEHSFAHVGKVADTAGYILRTMGYSDREAELAQIAGYLHDI
ncbi:MAG: HD domain-containing protein, partial [Lachnospiraceae bacterium]|nr:HD domain-containing protein [Lachnospiraceae bacterium]